MGILTVGQEMVAKFRDAKELTVLRDDDGNPLGLFSPILPARAEPASANTYSTRQVFELLLSLTTDEATRSHLEKIIAEVKERDACITR